MKKNFNSENFLKIYSSYFLLLFFLLANIIFTKNFLAPQTLNNIITQIAPVIIGSMGMTLVISTGGIDISIGSVMAFAGVLTATLMVTYGIIPAIIISIICSIFIGSIAGFMIGKMQLQAMVVTLGLMLGVRGLAQYITDGRDIYFNKIGITGEKMSAFGTYKIAGKIPIQIVPIIIAIIIVWILANKTVLGRQIQATGDNIKSSYLSGIDTNRVMLIVYGLSAAFAAVAGILQMTKTTVASGSSLGDGAELDAIAAVVIGGTPMEGGKPRVMGTVIGALIMLMIDITCNMNNIPSSVGKILKAVIIIFAVFIQRDKTK